MVNIFEEMDYRKIIRISVEERKRIDRNFNFQGMAAAIGIQKSYLSKVIRGDADLSSDQLFSVSEYLGFDDPQRKYLNLLLEWSRSSVRRRKDLLLADIRKIQAKFRETKAHLSVPKVAAGTQGVGDYYLDPIHQLVHIALSIQRYKENPALLAGDLGVSSNKIQGAIGKLEQLGIIRRKAGKLEILVNDVHLPRESSVYPAWRNQVKLMSIHRLEQSTKDQAYSFAVTFSADPETRSRIQGQFLDFLKKVEKLVKAAPAQEVYQMSFDLFSWTKP